MKCLRCGRDTVDENLFCQDCVEDMKSYPVPPRTAILLPKHPVEQIPKKQPRRKIQGPEDQMKKLKKQLRSVTIMMVLFALLAGLLAVPAWEYYQKSKIRPGQNYTSITATKETQ